MLFVFQDDQDGKQRMEVSLDAVNHVFVNRNELIGCTAKLANV